MHRTGVRELELSLVIAMPVAALRGITVAAFHGNRAVAPAASVHDPFLEAHVSNCDARR
jgi:hypothetical protein